MLLTYFVYFALAIASTPHFSDVSTVIGELVLSYFTCPSVANRHGTDSRAHIPPIGPSNPYLTHAREDTVAQLYDIPIGMVNRVVYGHQT